jgi:hypothetical protein
MDGQRERRVLRSYLILRRGGVDHRFALKLAREVAAPKVTKSPVPARLRRRQDPVAGQAT